MFEPVSNQPKFAEMEGKILDFWKHNKIFEKSLENRRDQEEYVFYDGPPFATGLPHYGHLLAGTIKDVIPRYQTMRGKYVSRTFGWDCHGLPVENEMEKELNLANKQEIENYGIDKFNEACRGIVLRYTAEWEQVVNRMGRWVDFKGGYRTMDLDYMESIWWVFRQLWDKGLIYEGYKILPYCPRCATPLSNFEANQGYEEVMDPAVTVRFKSLEEENTWFLAWTTTPWTLPSNLALAAGPEIDYVKVMDGDSYLIMAEARLSAYYKPEDMPEIVEKFKGSALENMRYEPLFSYFSDLKEAGAFKILLADYVSTEDGTGIVHTAPGFGEDDNAICKAYGLPEVCPIDESCCFTDEVFDYQGRYVKECDKDIIRRLKEEGKLVHRGQIKHNYPHCWRCDSPLIYRALPTWFVNIEKIKDKMIAANAKINWTPQHIKEGRFGKWLANARDWNIGRNRYWGCPLPIWRNESGEVVCIGSVKELESLTGKKIDDIHKHFMDKLEIPSKDGQAPLRRVTEVLDCWFESGSMPYAQQHYPFENKEHFEKNFPADFIAEGLDQTRGWFYTLVVLGAALFDEPPFENVVVNGLILAEDGQKMSKRKKNYPDPSDVIENYGADALRLFMLGSQVVRGEDLKFSETGIKDVLRGVMIPMWNAYSFFVTYANVDKWQPRCASRGPENPSNPLDRWILSSLAQMVEEIQNEMDNYNLQKAANRFEKFVEDLTNWYIRRSRRRFWKSQNDTDKNEAYETLHYVLLTFCRTAAPFIPFSTEAIYRNLRTEEMPESVHLCDYPQADNSRRDVYLETQMENTMTAVSLGRYLRSQHQMKVRQPLAKAVIVVHDDKVRKMLEETSSIISEELNVKEIEFSSNENEVVHRTAKANFKVLGRRLGRLMKEAAAQIAQIGALEIDNILLGGTAELNFSDGSSLEISADDLIIQRDEKAGMTVANEGGITIALDTVLNRELEEEGFAREFVSRIQNMRKDMDFEVSDRINIEYQLDNDFKTALDNFGDYICNEVLALSIEENTGLDAEAVDINGISVKIKVTRA
ncbi:isoleucine--tRNA ligase [Lentisphaerota bacterium ZTH]|nr:isoleucine--tRNA ligase [Lentisphaerota bacterium]WET05271.1 isoleucine--tRNA ligase [Lentisphaerota bacterium ZTH]